MSPRTAYAHLKSNLPVLLAVGSLLLSLGVLTNPVRALEGRLTAVEAQAAQRDTAIAEVRRYAKAAAIDLCLTRPDSVTARMDLNCRLLLNR